MACVTDKLSAVAFRLRVYWNEMPISTATGFLYRSSSCSLFLITNYHVLSGYNPLTGQPLHPQGALPNRVIFHLPVQEEHSDETRVIFKKMERRLLDQDGSPLWNVHPRLGNSVDVVGLELGYQGDARVLTINDVCQSHVFCDFDLSPGLDVFVIGFPLGLSVAKHLALWKRGTIASEPMFDINEKPLILIDSATREGMSGSPVIAQIRGAWGGSGAAGEISSGTWIGTGRQFIGVYSGRLGQDEFQAQLGLVWKKQVIVETIEGRETMDIATATPPPGTPPASRENPLTDPDI